MSTNHHGSDVGDGHRPPISHAAPEQQAI